MRKRTPVYFLFFACLFPFSIYAQVSIEKAALNTHLFKEFTKGSVLMKDGRVEEAFLNYDTEYKSIVFKKEEKVLILTDLQSVDTVYIQDRKFIPALDIFYEVVPGITGIGLYITYSNKKKPIMASPDHEGTTKQTGNQANNNVASAYVSRPNQLNYAVETSSQYWLRRGNSFYKVNNETQVLKVFPFKDNAAIKNYLRENKTDFKKLEDVVKLVNYCNSLIE